MKPISVVSFALFALGVCASHNAIASSVDSNVVDPVPPGNHFADLKTFDVDAALKLDVTTARVFLKASFRELDLELRLASGSTLTYAGIITSDGDSQGVRTIVARRDDRPARGNLKVITLVASDEGTTVTLDTQGVDWQTSEPVATRSTFEGAPLSRTPAPDYVCSNAGNNQGYTVVFSELDGNIVEVTLAEATFFDTSLLADYDQPKLIATSGAGMQPFAEFRDPTVASGGYQIIGKVDENRNVVVDVRVTSVEGAADLITNLACAKSTPDQ
jgi:hypothetical protein